MNQYLIIYLVFFIFIFCSNISGYFRGQMVSQVLVVKWAWMDLKVMKDLEALGDHPVPLDYR